MSYLKIFTNFQNKMNQVSPYREYIMNESRRTPTQFQKGAMASYISKSSPYQYTQVRNAGVLGSKVHQKDADYQEATFIIPIQIDAYNYLQSQEAWDRSGFAPADNLIPGLFFVNSNNERFSGYANIAEINMHSTYKFYRKRIQLIRIPGSNSRIYWF